MKTRTMDDLAGFIQGTCDECQQALVRTASGEHSVCPAGHGKLRHPSLSLSGAEKRILKKDREARDQQRHGFRSMSVAHEVGEVDGRKRFCIEGFDGLFHLARGQARSAIDVTAIWQGNRVTFVPA